MDANTPNHPTAQPSPSPSPPLPPSPPPPQAKLKDFKACQFSSWYHTFRNCYSTSEQEQLCNDLERAEPRKHATIRSVILQPLPAAFFEYLMHDGVHVPKGTNVSSCASGVVNETDDSDDESWSSDTGRTDLTKPTSRLLTGDDDDDENENETEHEKPVVAKSYEFPELTQSIANAIRKLGGSVVPKLNWSCPKDAAWVNGNSLKCTTPGDVYVLLSSSDFVMHDLLYSCTATDAAADEGKGEGEGKTPPSGVTKLAHDTELYSLVLRRWCNFDKGMEFRCFVTCNTIIAISQRDYTQPYPFLEREKTAIRRDIMEFFEEIIRPNFPAEVTRPTDNYDDVVQEYVFDCYIDRKRQVWLMDFNVWGSQTDPLLFEWSELVTMGHNRNAAVREVIEEKRDEAARGTANTFVVTSTPLPEIRIVSGNEDIRCDPLASYRAPIDAMDLTSDSFQKFMSTCKQES
mmetsp:Transcript_7753/g.9715  ORF Transcript_7753/g.9715 Transcript_7753/m.9715 type:complete len:460 (+) Transcript_7753:42-1421(+)